MSDEWHLMIFLKWSFTALCCFLEEQNIHLFSLSTVLRSLQVCKIFTAFWVFRFFSVVSRDCIYIHIYMSQGYRETRFFAKSLGNLKKPGYCGTDKNYTILLRDFSDFAKSRGSVSEIVNWDVFTQSYWFILHNLIVLYLFSSLK